VTAEAIILLAISVMCQARIDAVYRKEQQLICVQKITECMDKKHGANIHFVGLCLKELK
jgi:hypothetical protein